MFNIYLKFEYKNCLYTIYGIHCTCPTGFLDDGYSENC